MMLLLLRRRHCDTSLSSSSRCVRNNVVTFKRADARAKGSDELVRERCALKSKGPDASRVERLVYP